jgi:hypothetical protein
MLWFTSGTENPNMPAAATTKTLSASMTQENGWNEWSKHVLKELERLNESYESLRTTVEEIKTDVGSVAVTERRVDEIHQWRGQVDDVASPPQLKELVVDVQKLKTFRTTAITVWVVIQMLTSIALATANFWKG